MPYIILFTIITIFLIFTIVFRWLLHDHIRQSYLVGLALFYALSTLIRRSAPAARFIGGLTAGWGLMVYAFCIMLSVWCATCYLMNIIPDRRFKRDAGICMIAELIAFCAAAVLRYYHIQFYLQLFFICILCIGGVCIAIGIYYTIKNWRAMPRYTRILLIAAFCMIVWFLILLVLNLQGLQFVYICGSGILLYFIVYTAVSVTRLRRMLTEQTKPNANLIPDKEIAAQSSADTLTDEAQKNAFVIETVKMMPNMQQAVFHMMAAAPNASTKDIANQLNMKATTVKSYISQIYSRLGVHNRQDFNELVTHDKQP